ncbi:type VI immunity family protein [Chromobacterium violaceum]|uniref:type VI immunity family protein n=1 Tax=Chromobacterium violaceum TaxID=536 RepID=UPI0009DADAB3|nr:type VI immunity family protein [Chromobacterium violaceum]
MEQTSMPRQLHRLQQYQDELVWNLGSDDTVVIRPGLTATFFFENASKASVRQKIIECYDYFYELFGSKLKGQKYMENKTRKMTADSYRQCREKVLAVKDPNQSLAWFVSSEPTANYAAEYFISCFTRAELHEGWGHKSYLKIALPHTLLFQDSGLDIFKKLIAFICNAIQPVHGYSGLSPVLPYDFDRYLPNEYELAKRFIGLEVDSMSFSAGAHELQNHIKGANWLTILGDHFVQQLGGDAAIRAQLTAWPDITFSRYAGGLIIQAGEYPDLGAPEDGAPVPYVAVSRVVKPVRTTQPGSLHYYLPQQNGFDETDTVSWYERFDSVPLPEAAPESASAIEGMRCEADKPCPESGYWWTPAMENSRRHFTQGELMPNFPNSKYGSTIWYLDK